MSDTPQPTPIETPTSTPNETPTQEPQMIELEIDGVKQTFKPQQLLNVIKQYEDLTTKASEWKSSQEQIENLFAALKENPESIWDLAESLGHDPRELTKSKFKQYLEYEQMTPEQKRVFELEQKLSSYEKEKMKVEEEQKAQEQEALVERYYQSIEKEFKDFYSESGVTPSKELAVDLVKYQREQLELTGMRPSVKESYKVLQARNDVLRRQVLSQLSEDELPEELIKKVRQKLAKDAKKFPFTKQQSATPTPKPKLKSKLSIDDFFK